MTSLDPDIVSGSILVPIVLREDPPWQIKTMQGNIFGDNYTDQQYVQTIRDLQFEMLYRSASKATENSVAALAVHTEGEERITSIDENP